MLEFSLIPAPPALDLAPRWEALEEVADGGFFRSWCFVSAQMARFERPLLFAAREDGQDLALALLNRRRGRLWLNETGRPEADRVMVEHNGLLLRRGAGSVLAPALRALAGNGPVVLSGVDDAHLAAANAIGQVHTHASRFAPVVELRSLGGPYLDSLSANTRSQIRRALRLYGAPVLRRAGSYGEALAYFGRMIELHQAQWRARGHAGAFASADMRTFHAELIENCLPFGQAHLLRIETGRGDEIGYLYTFRYRDVVLNYQSGFAPAPDSRFKPGLVSHALAIEHYRAAGASVYDMLGGADRYKMSLAGHAGQTLHWLTLHAPGSLRGRVAALGRIAASRVRSHLGRGSTEPA